MKTLLTTLLLAASLTATSSSVTQAENQPARKPTQVATYQTGIYTTTEGKLQIALDKQTGGALTVRLVNQKGDVLFDQQIGKQQTSARLRLDLSELSDGAYQVVISNGRDVTTRSVTISSQPVATSDRLVALN
ncbi:T9SS type A sorting domain-containing protein [Spirosoma aerophilum]